MDEQVFQRRFPFDHELDPDQLRIVLADTDGELVIGGLAGTGKTAAALHRAAQIGRVSPARSESPVLFLCFNKALAAAARKWLNTFPGTIKRRIEVRNIDSWCRRHFGDEYGNRPFVKDKERAGIVYMAMREVQRSSSNQPVFRRDPYFFLTEIKLIKGCGYAQIEQYVYHKAASGSHLSLDELRSIWEVAKAYDQLLWNGGRIDFDDSANFVLLKRDGQRSPKQYDHVIVDEAQDLSASQLELVRSLARRSLTLIADQQQAIYTKRQLPDTQLPSFDSVVLQTNYRNATGISALARRLLSDEPPLPPGQDRDNPAVYRRFRYVEDEAAFIANHVARLINAGVPSGEIAVLTNFRQIGTPIKHACAAAGMELAVVEDGNVVSPGIHITTIYQAKGREFEAVFVPGLTEGVLPRVRPDMDIAAQDQEIALGRRLLNVAITRARHYLFLSSAEGRPSRYIYDLGLEPAPQVA